MAGLLKPLKSGMDFLYLKFGEGSPDPPLCPTLPPPPLEEVEFCWEP